MNFKINLLAFSILLMFTNLSFSQSTLLDDFEDLSNWQKIVSDGVTMHLSIVDGYKGKCIKLDYEFKGSGYCGIQKNISLNLPKDYKFSYYLKANSPNNNLEFKLTDSTGDNVWWFNQRNLEFPTQWQRMLARRRDIVFAWGPMDGGEINKAYNLQIIISASQGGKGTVYIDDLNFEKIIPPANPNAKPIITVTSTLKGSCKNLLNNNSSGWQSDSNEEQSLIINFQFVKEFGGLIIDWDSVNYAKNYEVLISNDEKNWEKVYSKDNAREHISFIYLKNGESQFVKIRMNNSSSENGYRINKIIVENFEFSQTYNNFFHEVAKYYPKGFYPKYFYDTQSYWNIIGVSEDYKEGLINEEGAIEVDKGSFRIEPFIYSNGHLITWANAKVSQNLENEYLPIPSVKWETQNLHMEIKAFAEGEAGKSSIVIRYRIKNSSTSQQKGSLYLAVRPFQVNPPWQNINLVGGVSKIKSIEYKDDIVIVNDEKNVIPVSSPQLFGTAKFDDGDIINYLNKDELPNKKEVHDEFNFASGAFRFVFNLKPDSSKDYVIIIPFYKNSKYLSIDKNYLNADSLFESKLSEVKKFWTGKLNQVQFDLPTSADKYINSLRSNLAYILINKDGPAIQPGSRTYERAWIRDGSLTSSALLRLGIKKEVKDYLDWYSKYQYPDGKIPCVVDTRGADPTAENDSHGEFIYAILQYFIFTHDTAFLAGKYENVKKAVDYIEYLVDQRKTTQYQKKDSLAFYGIMPESISHEGYSSKPMHSYWDDFFTVRGLKDAVTIAQILKRKDDEKKFIDFRDEFEKNLYNSINLAMKMHNINYIPGCVELGDFDATSTTIALYPANELQNLPEPQLDNTFDKYYRNFVKRLDPNDNWVNYTPYEIRVAGTFLYLGQKDRTHKLLDFFFSDQRPKEWNHWAEVVWKNKNEPKYIGDMPHTWVGSDYITVVRSIFGYERESDSSLVLGAGIKSEWLERPQGLAVNNFATQYGIISYQIQKRDNKIIISLKGNITIPEGQIIIKSPIDKPIKSITINDNTVNKFENSEIKIDEIPAKIVLGY